MTHVYDFELYRTPISTPCRFTYTGETVIPNDVIKELVTAIIIHVTKIWLTDNSQCMNDSANLSILKQILKNENRMDLVEWLEPFTDLTMRNGNPEREAYGAIYVHLR